MKTIIKIFVLAMAIAMPLTSRGFDIGNLRYDVVGDGKVSIKAINSSQMTGAFTIPSTVTDGTNTYTVTQIPNNAFINAPITSLTIPSSVTIIGPGAFAGCSQMQTLTFEAGSSLTTIDYSAFNKCTSLLSVNIPGSVTTLNYSAFQGCTALQSVTFNGNYTGDKIFLNCTSLTQVNIGSDVTVLPNWMFSGCTSLSSLTLPANVTTLGTGVFANTGFTSFVIPETVTTIGSSVFSGCKNLTSVTFPSHITTIPDCIFSGCTAMTSYSVPAHINAIGTQAFYNCTNLTTLQLNNYVNNIGVESFKNCSGLTSVDLTGVVVINTNAFQGTGLTTVTVPSTVTTLSTGAFADCNSLGSAYIYASCVTGSQSFIRDANLTSVTIGTNVLGLGEMMFQYCTKLSSVTFANGSQCTSIGNNAFDACKDLTSINLPSGITTIGTAAFNNCQALQTLSLPTSLTSIGNSAFSGCTSLNNVTLPNSVTSIGNSLFLGCTSLSNVTIGSGITALSDNMFVNCKAIKSINVPATVTRYGNSVFSGSGLTSFVVNDNVTSMGIGVFSNCDNLVSATLSNQLTAIPNATFSGCTNLASYTIPAEITVIGNSAFMGCNALKSIVIPGTVKTINNAAFSGCSALATVTLQDGIETLAQDAFLETGVTSIIVPSTVTSIGQGAFARCNSLVNATLHSSGTVDKWVFSGCKALETIVFDSTKPVTFSIEVLKDCTKLTSATLPVNLTSWGARTFQGCSLLTTVNIPESLTAIASNTFDGCSSLQSISLPSSITDIESSAFISCSAMESIVLPNKLKTIGVNAFKNCTSLSAINIPSSVTSIGDGAFRSCKSLESIVIPNSVTGLGGGMFEDSDHLITATLPNTLTVLPIYTFKNCTSLESLEIPGTVTNLNNQALYNCSSLQTLRCEAVTPPTIGSNALYGITPANVSLVVPQQCLQAYQDANTWNTFNLSGTLAYDVAVSVNDAASGTAAVTPNQTVFFPNKRATLTATNNRGFTFTNWSENNVVLSTDPEYDIVVTDNRNITANFRTYDRMEIPSSPEHPFYYKWGTWTVGSSTWGTVNNCWEYIRKGYRLSYPLTVVEQVPMVLKMEVGTPNNNQQIAVYLYKDNAIVYSHTVDIANNGYWDAKPFPIYEVELPELELNEDYTLVLESLAPSNHNSYTVNIRSVDIVADPGGITGISVDCTECELNVGETLTIAATIEPADAKNKTVTWSSSNSAIATVNSTGLVTAVSVGVATITATSANGMTATCEIEVSPVPFTIGTGVNSLTFHDYPNKDTRPDNFVAKNTSNRWVANKIVITDAEPYENTEDVEAIELEYSRTFTHTDWQPLYVPFNMSYSEWADVADVAMINDVHQFDTNNDGIFESTTLEFKRLGVGSEILPNVPYVIKPKETGDVTFTCADKTLKGVPSGNGSVDCSSTTLLYTLEGIYQQKTDMDGVYAMRDGAFVRATSSSYPLSPMRIFLTIEPRNGGYGTPAANHAPAYVRMSVDGVDVTTGIFDLLIDSEDDGIYYDLLGRKVKDPAPGVYIKDGKKVFIK